MSEVGELVSLVVAPASVSAFGAVAVAVALVHGDGATRCISEIAEVVSSVAAPIRGAALGVSAANDVPACCEVNSFGIDDVVSAFDPLTGGTALALAAISSGYEEDGPGSP